MKSSIKNQIQFTPRERRGIISLLFLSSLLLAFIFIYDRYAENHRTTFDFLPDLIDHNSLTTDSITIDIPTKDLQIKKSTKVKREINLRPFDPNTVTKSELISMNLPSYGINSFLNYRSTGKKFYSVKDFKSVYGFEKLNHESLVENLILPAKPSYHKNYPKKIVLKTDIDTISNLEIVNNKILKYKPFSYDIAPQSININTATIEELNKLKGIANYRSSKIIEYRDALHGFHSIDQLYEISQVPDSIISQNLVYFTLDSNQIKGIDINGWTFDQFRKHPYIGYKKAQLLSRYIKEHGPLHSSEDLTQIIALDSSFINRLSPYLKYN